MKNCRLLLLNQSRDIPSWLDFTVVITCDKVIRKVSPVRPPPHPLTKICFRLSAVFFSISGMFESLNLKSNLLWYKPAQRLRETYGICDQYFVLSPYITEVSWRGTCTLLICILIAVCLITFQAEVNTSLSFYALLLIAVRAYRPSFEYQ